MRTATPSTMSSRLLLRVDSAAASTKSLSLWMDSTMSLMDCSFSSCPDSFACSRSLSSEPNVICGEKKNCSVLQL